MQRERERENIKIYWKSELSLNIIESKIRVVFFFPRVSINIFSFATLKRASRGEGRKSWKVFGPTKKRTIWEPYNVHVILRIHTHRKLFYKISWTLTHTYTHARGRAHTHTHTHTQSTSPPKKSPLFWLGRELCNNTLHTHTHNQHPHQKSHLFFGWAENYATTLRACAHTHIFDPQMGP